MMFAIVKESIRRTPLAMPFIYLKGKVTRPTTQNDEGRIIATLVERFDPPKCFIEFGFSGWEFNCASLAYEWEGLLVDGDRYNVTIARTILPKRVQARKLWLTLETMSVIRDYAKGREIGILSVDVDGNDYWFLESLLPLKPAIIIAEYNSILGLRPITVPYDPAFNRMNYGDGWYFGASLTALVTLLTGYSLVAQTGGINAFFVRNDLLKPGDKTLTAAKAYEPRRVENWDAIKHLPFVEV